MRGSLWQSSSIEWVLTLTLPCWRDIFVQPMDVCTGQVSTVSLHQQLQPTVCSQAPLPPSLLTSCSEQLLS